MRRSASSLAAVGMVLAMSACGGSPIPPHVASPTPAPPGLSYTFVTDGHAGSGPVAVLFSAGLFDPTNPGDYADVTLRSDDYITPYKAVVLGGCATVSAIKNGSFRVTDAHDGYCVIMASQGANYAPLYYDAGYPDNYVLTIDGFGAANLPFPHGQGNSEFFADTVPKVYHIPRGQMAKVLAMIVPAYNLVSYHVNSAPLDVEVFGGCATVTPAHADLPAIPANIPPFNFIYQPTSFTLTHTTVDSCWVFLLRAPIVIYSRWPIKRTIWRVL